MKNLTYVLALSAAISFFHGTSAQTLKTCGTTISGATFNLAEIAGDVLVATDSRQEGYESKFLYKFGICTNLDKKDIPSDCPDYSSKTISSIQYIENAPNTCSAISGDIADSATKASFSLVEEKDPSMGVALTYQNGDVCSVVNRDGTTSQYARSVRMDFICADRDFLPSDIPVIEDTVCTYHVIFKTKYGCPLECPTVDPSGVYSAPHTCNAHGVCRYNFNDKKPQCYCNEGWTGESCTERGSHDSSVQKGSTAGAVVGGLFGGIALGAILGAGAYYYFVVRGSHKASDSNDAAAYSSGADASWEGVSSSYRPPESGNNDSSDRGEPLL